MEYFVKERCFSWKEILNFRMRNVFLYSNFIFNLTAAGRKQRKIINMLHSGIEKVNIANINV